MLIEALDPSDIEGLFRAGATEVIAAHSICGSGHVGEGAVDSDWGVSPEPDVFVDREPGAPRATRGPRVDDYGKAEAEHVRRPPGPLACGDVGASVPYGEDLLAVDMGYVHGVSLADGLDEVEGLVAGDGPHVDVTAESPVPPLPFEQPAVPAWTKHLVRLARRGRCRPRRQPLHRWQTLRRCRIELRSSAPSRDRAAVANRRLSHDGACRFVAGSASCRTRFGPNVWKSLRLAGRRCPA